MSMGKALRIQYGLPIVRPPDTYSPTAAAALDHLRAWRPDPRLARGSAHTKTRLAHHLCPGGCGAKGKPGHEDCATGCGTHNARKCGGRYFAARTKHSVSNDDNTLRIKIGLARQARINARGW